MTVREYLEAERAKPPEEPKPPKPPKRTMTAHARREWLYRLRRAAADRKAKAALEKASYTISPLGEFIPLVK